MNDIATQDRLGADRFLAGCLAVRNVEGGIGDFLGRVVPLLDEIIVADLGSSDRTVDIALEYGASVLSMGPETEENSILATSMNSVSCKWCLSLDFRDQLSNEDLWELRDASREFSQ